MYTTSTTTIEFLCKSNFNKTAPIYLIGAVLLKYAIVHILLLNYFSANDTFILLHFLRL